MSKKKFLLTDSIFELLGPQVRVRALWDRLRDI